MHKKNTILILEDSREDFYLLSEMLESSAEMEVEIIHENRLERAIATAGNQPIDIAVIDLHLPDSSGLDTFHAFHGAHPFIPVVIHSGYKNKDIAFEAVSKGAQDYLFKGEPSSTAVIRTIRYAIERQRLLTELKAARDHVKQLRGIIPICANCKMIRDDEGYWNQVESYIRDHSEAEFSHSLCPNCATKLYPDLGMDFGTTLERK